MISIPWLNASISTANWRCCSYNFFLASAGKTFNAIPNSKDVFLCKLYVYCHKSSKPVVDSSVTILNKSSRETPNAGSSNGLELILKAFSLLVKNKMAEASLVIRLAGLSVNWSTGELVNWLTNPTGELAVAFGELEM